MQRKVLGTIFEEDVKLMIFGENNFGENLVFSFGVRADVLSSEVFFG